MLVRPLQQEGYHVLRYNSRGVGKSTGWASLTGSREAQDLNELVQWAITTLTSVAAVAVIGYSYGSLISSLFPVLPDIKTDHILISYPVGPRHWLTAFRGRAYATALQTLLINSAARVLILYGTQDEFTSVETYGGWAGSLEEHAKGAERNLRIVKIEGATHFWREHEQADKMVEEIVQWVH